MATELKVGDIVRRKCGTEFSFGQMEAPIVEINETRGHCWTHSTEDKSPRGRSGFMEFDEVEIVAATREAEDIVTKPSHYSRWVIEPITYIMRNGFEFWRGNIVKYASRAGHKKYDGLDETQSEITDLKKVIRYAEMRINQLEGEQVL